MAHDYLSSLNPDQQRAVTFDPDIPLQVLAGPGSGKTKVLTARMCHLVQNHHVKPECIVAVTFTNKAAKEMRHRLEGMLGKAKTGKLILGTFHAICALFLRKYGTDIGLPSNFSICDSDESQKIIKSIISKNKFDLADPEQFKPGAVISLISKAKAKGLTPERQAAEANKKKDKTGELIAQMYADYEQELSRINSLDFDDLLVYGVKLMKASPKISSRFQHVLVDEFQDTNLMQFDLMVEFASNGRLTIVGDPDQSIYGWRSAEVENLYKMKQKFPQTQEVHLEQNYRSTGSIIACSLAIVAEDKRRIQKTLHTTHAAGPLPTLLALDNEYSEADFIAAEILRLAGGGTFKWGDFAILLRYNALSRSIEAALQKHGIPNRMLAGLKFFERLEIKDVLAYLQLVDNPSYAPAFLRIINIPKRGIGQKSLDALVAKAHTKSLSLLEVVELLHSGKISPGADSNLKGLKTKTVGFLDVICKLRKDSTNGVSVPRLIERVLQLTEYEEHLKRTQEKDWETRMENIAELVNFATEIEQTSRIDPGNSSQSGLDFSQDNAEKNTNGTPLRLFLEQSMLATDTETKGEGETDQKVTISTCHAAKGLEWPVVIVPGVELGHFPFHRAEDEEEERRLLYVACTRAQGLLYLTHTRSRMTFGEKKERRVSTFIGNINKNLFSPFPPALSNEDRRLLGQVLSRELPLVDEAEVKVWPPPSLYPQSTPLVPIAPSKPVTFTSARGFISMPPPTQSLPNRSIPPLPQITHIYSVGHVSATTLTLSASGKGKGKAAPSQPTSSKVASSKQSTLLSFLGNPASTELNPPVHRPNAGPAMSSATKSPVRKGSFVMQPMNAPRRTGSVHQPQPQPTMKPGLPSAIRPPLQTMSGGDALQGWSRTALVQTLELTTSKAPPLLPPPFVRNGGALSQVVSAPLPQPVKLAGGVKRLGMGHSATGYQPNKKRKVE